MATRKQIRDELFDIEDRIKPLFPRIPMWIFVMGIGLLGVVGILLLLTELSTWNWK